MTAKQRDMRMIRKLSEAMKDITSDVNFYLPVETDVDLLIVELSKVYKVYKYNVQLTSKLSINIWNA